MTARRICFVGDSQLAAVKLGWDLVKADYPGIACHFFGGHGGTMREVVVAGDALVATSEIAKATIAKVTGGETELRPNQFDVVCLVGLKYRFDNCLKLIARLRTHEMTELRRCALVSKALLRELVDEVLVHSLAIDFIRMIRSVSSVPLVFMPDPMPSEHRLSEGPLGKLTLAELQPSIGAVYALYCEATERIAAEKGVTLVVQPAGTLAIPGLTRAEYAHGSVRLRATLDQPHPEGDHLHMNGPFGAEMMREVFKAIDADGDRSAICDAVAAPRPVSEIVSHAAAAVG